MNGAERAYVDRLITTGGKTKTEALRLLRRRLSDVVFRTLLTDHDTGAVGSTAGGPLSPRLRKQLSGLDP